MKLPHAIILTLFIMVLMVFLGRFWAPILLVFISIGVFWDARRIGAEEWKKTGHLTPGVFAIATYFAFVFGFPFYLWNRYKLKNNIFPEVNQNESSNPKKIFVISGVISAIVIVVLLGSLYYIVSFYFKKAEITAQKSVIAKELSFAIQNAFVCYNENGTLSGFKPQVMNHYTGNRPLEPIVNISSDGKELAIFVDNSKNGEYICNDTDYNLSKVTKDYALSGKTFCGENAEPLEPLLVSPLLEDYHDKNSDRYGYNIKAEEDIKTIESGFTYAKQWTEEPELVLFSHRPYVSKAYSNLKESLLVFKPKEYSEKVLIMNLAGGTNKLVSYREGSIVDIPKDSSYIEISLIKISSHEAFLKGEALAKKYCPEFNVNISEKAHLQLLFFAKAQKQLWSYILTNKTESSEKKCSLLIDSETGEAFVQDNADSNGKTLSE